MLAEDIKTLLVVNDAPANLSVLVPTLEQAGFDVPVATNAKQALERAALGAPELILLQNGLLEATTAQLDPSDLPKETAMNPTPATPATAEAPKPMPFAIMRNAHEALRASIRLQHQALESGDQRAFEDEWRRLRRGLAVHMAMEDDAMFALLDEASGGAISAAGLPAEHDEDTRLAASVDAALTGSDLAALRFAWLAWRDEHLRHLEHEEAVMMPLTMKTAPTPDGRARIVHDRLLTPSAQHPDFDWFVGWVVTMLSRHGSSSQPPAVATRVFAWGLQHASSPEQWRRWRPIVAQSCPPGMWTELAAGFDLDADGKIA